MKVSDYLRKYGSDKISDHFYGGCYDLWFTPRKLSATSVLELGVYYGQSMRAWHDYFPNATIYGVDHERKELIESRIKTITCSQADIHTLTFPMMDIIIDDCSHVPLDQIYSFGYLRRFLKPNGLYIIEDVPSIEVANAIHAIVPSLRIIDLRSVTTRFDDIL